MQKKRGGAFMVLLTCILAAPTVACLMGFMPFEWNESLWPPYMMVGAILGLVHIILRPILRLISLPLGCLTLGLSGTVIDVALIYLSAGFVKNFEVPSLLYAILTALTVNVISGVVGRR